MDKERLFWECVYRAVMMVACAIKRYKLSDEELKG
jgi:hypothetical protein